MKKALSVHVTAHIPETQAESYRSLWSYFYPELITAFLLYTALGLIDSWFISRLGNTSAYATLGITDTLFHLITKIADGFSVGMVVLCGHYNGIEDYHRTGKVLSDAFWITVVLGLVIASILYYGAYGIYAFYEVPEDIVALGVPFLRLRALGVFFNFVYFALIGFFRGIKNTRVPMMLFLLGSCVFIGFDYALIFGAWHFPQLGFQGSALASVLQYCFMLIGALGYIFLNPAIRKYGIQLFSGVKWQNISALITVSWPVMIDKASFALCYIWLTKMIACVAKSVPCEIGTCILPTYSFMKCTFQLALLPGIACAQIITFLVSNDYKAQNWQRIKNNITRVLIISSCLVASLLLILMVWPRTILSFFDTSGSFTEFALRGLPFMCLFIFFDLIQVILSAALRGAGNVRMVMRVRLLVTGLYFMPLSYLLLFLPIDNILIKFILIYGLFYSANALMSIIYLHRFKHEEWKQQAVKGV